MMEAEIRVMRSGAKECEQSLTAGNGKKSILRASRRYTAFDFNLLRPTFRLLTSKTIKY